MLESKDFDLDESFNNEKLLEIVKELYPERKVYYRITIAGKFVVVNINPFNCIFTKIVKEKKNSKMHVRCSNENTVLGVAFLGGLVGYFLSKSKGEEIENTIVAEIERRYVK